MSTLEFSSWLLRMQAYGDHKQQRETKWLRQVRQLSVTGYSDRKSQIWILIKWYKPRRMSGHYINSQELMQTWSNLKEQFTQTI